MNLYSKDVYFNFLSTVKPMNTLTLPQQIKEKGYTICHICKKIVFPLYIEDRHITNVI